MPENNFQNAKQALENYCAYQERCSSEVLLKMNAFSLSSEDRMQLISDLKRDNFLSDERYCSAIVSGKFRINRWGKIKIKAYLKQKMLPDALIKKAIDELDPDEYLLTLGHLAQKKSEEINEKDSFKKQSKLIRYLLAKGFEYEIIKDVVRGVL